jgi:hypothetical protein
MTKGEYYAVKQKIKEASESQEYGDCPLVILDALEEAENSLDAIWQELEKRRRVMNSMGHTLVEISVLLEKHKKVVKEAR